MVRIITKTLADLYYQQGHLKKAYEIYQALSEREPDDKEIQIRLRELGEKLGISTRPEKSSPSTEEKIRALERWLANIRQRKRR
ncbi:MAG: tetratricopeptide repeat protein [Syntrophaceae bacterium]|nr:tetratricopeptide repeat protein [Syntrophaceae bacterium]